MKLFDGILILAENPAFCTEHPYELELLGKPMREWVSRALGDTPFCANAGADEDFLHAISGYESDAQYTVVLWSDTPLVQKRTVLEAIDAIQSSNKRCLRLTRGWIFETAFLKNLSELPSIERFYLSDEEDFLTCADYRTLAFVSETMRQRILSFYMSRGVRIVDPATTYIDGDVVLGKGVTIYPSNTLRGRTVVGEGATLDSGNVIIDSAIGEGATVMSSRLEACEVGARTRVGPFAYLRKGAFTGSDCKVGDFVELKNVKLGDGTKVSHLTYLGDAEIGKDCNFGCGTITANYDGARKYKTEIGDHVFVGSNTTLIAPVKVGDGSFIAAGSTVTEDVEERALAIARARQVNYADRTKW